MAKYQNDKSNLKEEMKNLQEIQLKAFETDETESESIQYLDKINSAKVDNNLRDNFVNT